MSHFESFYEATHIAPESLDPKGLRDLEIGRYSARGRQLQAQAVRGAVVGTARSLRRGLRWATGLVLAPGTAADDHARTAHS